MEQVEIIISSEFPELASDPPVEPPVLYLAVPTAEAIHRDLLLSVLASVNSSHDCLGDAAVHCRDGVLRLPSPFLAAVCPVFKDAAGVEDEASLVLPDVSAAELGLFLDHLCLPGLSDKISSAAADSALLDGILDEVIQVRAVFDLLTCHTTAVTQSRTVLVNEVPTDVEVGHKNEEQKPARGRKRGSRNTASSLPSVLTEVVETERAGSASYSLRRTIKRRRFDDELSHGEIEDEEEVLDDQTSFERPSDAEESSRLVQRDDESDEEDLEDEQNATNSESWFLYPSCYRFPDNLFACTLLPSGEILPGSAGDCQSGGGLDGVVAAVSDDDHAKIKRSVKLGSKLAFEGVKQAAAKWSSTAGGNPRSLLRRPTTAEADPADAFVCSSCGDVKSNLLTLLRHVAAEHKGSRLLTLPKDHPHVGCKPCAGFFQSYERALARDEVMPTDCLICLHCWWRFDGLDLPALVGHLARDHRTAGNVDNANSSAVVKKFDDALKCDHCDAVFGSLRSLNRHLIRCTHGTESSAGLNCWACGKAFSDQACLKGHLMRHGLIVLEGKHDHPCWECPVVAESQATLSAHKHLCHTKSVINDIPHEGCETCASLYNSFSEDSMRMIRCPHCGVTFSSSDKSATMRYFANHVTKFHAEEPGLVRVEGQVHTFSDGDPAALFCPFCQHRSGERHGHNEHVTDCQLSSALNRPSYPCGFCGSAFATSRQFTKHLTAEHSGAFAKKENGDLSCGKCDYVGKSVRLLRQHQRRKHRPKTDPSDVAVVVSTAPCAKCGKVKRCGQPMRLHLARCGSGPRRVACPDCPMEFKRREDMQAHALVHYGQVTCPVHNVLFRQESEVFQHAAARAAAAANPSNAGSARLLQCCMCGAAFRHMCHFMKHLRRHLRIRAYRCGLCDKHFHSYSALQVHQSGQHGVAPSTKSDYDDENASPTPRPVFHCEHCSRSFSTRGHLKEHLLGVHGGPRQVQCPLCEKGFNTDKRMRKHLYTAHKESADAFRSRSKVEAFVEPDSALLLLSKD